MQQDQKLNNTIQNIMPGLTEIGKIKIGKKGAARKTSGGADMRLPTKLDHFIITTLERGNDDNFVENTALMQKFGDPKNLKAIPIRLLFDDIGLNFQSRYACYKGRQVWCSGDGVNAYRIDDKGVRQRVPCPCGRQLPEHTRKDDNCKMHGVLSCIIDGADLVGGVWKFRTTGFNSTVGIMSSLSLIQTFTGGVLAGLPLIMKVQPKVGTDPAGKAVSIHVVGIFYNGPLQELRNQALEIATQGAEYRQRLMAVEDNVRKLISVDAELTDQAGDIKGEYYPETPQIEAPQDAPAPVGNAASEEAPQDPPAPPAPETPKKRRGRPKKDAAPKPAPEQTEPTEPPAAPPETPKAETPKAEPAQPETPQSAEDDLEGDRSPDNSPIEPPPEGDFDLFS